MSSLYSSGGGKRGRGGYPLEGFNATLMPRDFFDPQPDEIDIVLVDERTANEAALLFVDCCEACCPEDAEVPFDWVLDYLTGRRGSNTDYILAAPPKCPNCRRDIRENTLVRASRWIDAESSFQS